MREYSNTTSMELTFSEISTTLVSLILHTEKHIKFGSPVIVVKNYLAIIRKLNAVLKENGFDHFTDERFEEFEAYIVQREGGE